jgi:hypothetical protein
MASDSSILRRMWNHLNGMQRTTFAIAILYVFMIGGALYWEEDYEKQFAVGTSTQAETVTSTFSTAPALMGFQGLTHIGGFLLALLAGILSVMGELLEAVARPRK